MDKKRNDSLEGKEWKWMKESLEEKKSRTDFIMYLKEKNIVNLCATLDCEVKVWMLWDDNWKGIVVA